MNRRKQFLFNYSYGYVYKYILNIIYYVTIKLLYLIN